MDTSGSFSYARSYYLQLQVAYNPYGYGDSASKALYSSDYHPI